MSGDDRDGGGRDVVSYEVHDRVAVLTIERPERRNAMSLEVFDRLRAHVERAGSDDAAGAVVVRGRDGVFSSGIDTAVLRDQARDGIDLDFIERLQSSFTAFEDCPKPTIAAIEGHCYGAGLQLAVACHLRAVAPTARLAILEPRWGLIPDLGGTHRLPRLVGLGRAIELVVSARTVDADEAHRMGLAEIRLDAKDPHADALAYAARLAAGPLAVRLAPQLIRDNLGRSRAQALRYEAETQQLCIAGEDFREAVRAASEEREPRFVGR